MKNLITTIDISCSEQNSAIPYFGKVKGVILAKVIDASQNLTISMEYRKEDNTPLLSKVANYTLAEQETLYQAVKSQLNKNQNPTLVLDEACYFGFVIEMAQTFGISTTDIEIITV